MIPLRSDKLQAGQGTLSLTNHGYVSPATMDALLARAAEMPAGTVFPEDKQANFVQTHGLPCLVRDTEKFTDFVVNVEPLASMMSPSGKATTCPVDDQIFLNKFTLESFAVRLNKALEVEPYRRPTEDFYLASVTFAASAYSARDKGSLSTDYTELCEKIKAKFVEKGISIVEEGEIDGPKIDSEKYIDQHYYAIASKATILPPKDLNIPLDKFKDTFGEEWSAALADDRVHNALDIAKKLGWDAAKLDEEWNKTDVKAKPQTRIKFGGGFYCGQIEHEGKKYYTLCVQGLQIRAPGPCPSPL